MLTAGTLSGRVLDAEHPAREGLKSRPAPADDRGPAEVQRKIGDLAMEIDILRALNEDMDRRPHRPRR